MFSLDKRRLRENMIVIFKYLKGFHEEEEEHICFPLPQGAKYSANEI